MYQCIVFPSDYTPFKQEILLAAAIMGYEFLTYPLDFIGNRSIQREQYYSKSLIAESKLIYSEFLMWLILWVKVKDGPIIEYYLFNYLQFNYAFKNYISPKYKEELDTTGFDITPENSTIYPLLRYVKIIDPAILGFAAISNLVGMLASHPISILKVRLQNEILQKHQTKTYTDKMKEMTAFGGHKMWFKTAFVPRFLYTYLQFILEMGSFQFFLNKLGYEFINVFRPKVDFNGNALLLGFSLIGSSALSAVILQPLYFYYQRSTYQLLIRKPINSTTQYLSKVMKTEGFSSIMKGYIHNATRSVARNIITVGTLWYFATSANQERFRPDKE